MVKYNLFFSCLFFIYPLLRSQTSDNVSARSIALASSVATMNDLSVSPMNPSVYVNEKGILLGFQNVSMRTTIGIQKNALLFSMPLKRGVVGFALQSYGTKVYRLINGGFTYTFSVSESLKAGVCLGYKNTSIEHYGALNQVDLTFAIQGKLTDRITYGMSIHSLHARSLMYQEVNPTVLFVGVKYTSSNPKFNLYTEIEKSVTNVMRAKVACEYFILPTFIFRSGWMSSAYQLSSGVGIWWKKKLRIDLGGNWQSITGVTMQVGIIFSNKDRDLSNE